MTSRSPLVDTRPCWFAEPMKQPVIYDSGLAGTQQTVEKGLDNDKRKCS